MLSLYFKLLFIKTNRKRVQVRFHLTIQNKNLRYRYTQRKTNIKRKKNIVIEVHFQRRILAIPPTKKPEKDGCRANTNIISLNDSAAN